MNFNSCPALDNAAYSASELDNVVCPCALDDQPMLVPPTVYIPPETLLLVCLSVAKLESATAMNFLSKGFLYVNLMLSFSLFRYPTKCSTAFQCPFCGLMKNFDNSLAALVPSSMTLWVKYMIFPAM